MGIFHNYISELKPLLVVAALISLFASCTGDRAASLASVVSAWEGREIVFPENPVFTIQGRDTVDFPFRDAPYKIVSYVDSMGCMSCKLHLSFWKGFIRLVDSISSGTVRTAFFLNARDMDEINLITKRSGFDYPVCFDKDDELNALNGFPSIMEYQTFLLDKENKVVLAGNPALSPDIRNRYLSILGENREESTRTTMADAGETDVYVGALHLGEKWAHRFVLRNTGQHDLIVDDLIPSCDCMEVTIDRQTIPPGESMEISVIYTPDEQGDFLRTVSVYCSVEGSPIELSMYGTVQ